MFVDAATGDTRNALDHHRLAVGFACQALIAKGEWDAVLRVCDDLDALIGLQLEMCKGPAAAGEYRELCQPWTDGFFERSLLRRG